jgi:hypothetical protein
MQMRKVVAAVLVASVLVSPVGFAEPAIGAPVDIGGRVRLKSAAVRGGVVGVVVDADETSLTVKRDGGTRNLRIPWESLSRLQVSDGRKHRGENVAKGAVIGGLVVAFPAAVGAGQANIDCEHECHAGPMFATGVLIGAGLGAIIGMASKTDRWTTVRAPRRPRVMLGVSPVPRGAGASLGVSF